MIITPTITFDFKQYRIRIFKSTVSMLGNPDYIQLLVHPKSNLVALRVSSANERFALDIRRGPDYKKEEYSIHSKALLEELHYICPTLCLEQTYRVTGRYIPKENVVIFNLITAKIVEE